MEGTRTAGTIRSLGAIDGVFALDGLERLRCEMPLPSVAQNWPMLVDGSVADPAVPRACRDARIVIDGATFSAARFVRRQRADVAAAYGVPALEFAGFTLVIEPESLAPGRHELVVSIDGDSSNLPALAFEIAAPVRLRTQTIRSERFRFACAIARRYERGMPAAVRGTVAASGRPKELYGILDGCDTFPVQLDAPEAGAPRTPGTVPFLACFATRGLALGAHELRFAAIAEHEAGLHLSEPYTFAVSPLAVAGVRPRFAETLAAASIDWADAEPSAAVAHPARRPFARGEIACVRGWAVDTAARDSARSAFVRFANGTIFALEMRGARGDVALSLGMPDAANCGFTGSIATDALDRGRNTGSCYIVAKRAPIAYRTLATIEIDVSG